MEVSEYAPPASWGDKGMDWSDPDPENADYVMAIRAAIMERSAALHTDIAEDVAAISPHRPVSIRDAEICAEAVRRLVPNFVNMGYADYEADYSDFPRNWTYPEITREDGCDMSACAFFGTLCKGGGAWLRAMKNVLDLLTVIPCREMRGVMRSANGSEHDPPFGESIGTAMSRAMESMDAGPFANASSFDVHAWSGNTHWCRPRKDDPDSKDGYCGFAEGRDYTVNAVRSWLAGSAFDLVVAVLAKAPDTPCGYSEVLDAGVFDAGEAGFAEGFSLLAPMRVEDPSDVGVMIGNAAAIPKNPNVPSSEFDEDGNAVRRHSTKIGHTARAWLLMDYGVPGGFGFRKGE